MILEQPIGGAATVKRGARSGSTVELVMHTPAQLSGVVVDAQGEVVPKFELLAVNTATSTQSRERTDNEQGQWTLKDVPPGPIQLWVRSQAGAGDLKLDVKPGQSVSDLRWSRFAPTRRFTT